MNRPIPILLSQIPGGIKLENNEQTKEQNYWRKKLESNEQTKKASYGETKLESNEETKEESYGGKNLESNKEETKRKNYGETREDIDIKSCKSCKKNSEESYYISSSDIMTGWNDFMLANNFFSQKIIDRLPTLIYSPVEGWEKNFLLWNGNKFFWVGSFSVGSVGWRQTNIF